MVTKLPIVKPYETARGVELDVRHIPLLGEQLKECIWESVRATQKYILVTLPNWLKVSHRQFISLQEYTEQLERTTDRIFITDMNVMEVDVDVDVDPVDVDKLIIEVVERDLVGGFEVA